MKRRTKWILIGSSLGLLVIGWLGASHDQEVAVAALERGEAALKAQQWEIALEAFSQSLEASEIYSTLSREQTRAHLGRGTALAMLGQQVAAVQAFSLAYSLDPRSAPPTNSQIVVEASEKAKAALESRREEAEYLAKTGTFDQAPDNGSSLPATTAKDELLGVLNHAAGLLGDEWVFQDLQINARRDELWLELVLQRRSLGITSDQVRAQAALVIAIHAAELATVFGVSDVRLRCEESVGTWTTKNLVYAGSLLQDKDTFAKGAALLLTMMK